MGLGGCAITVAADPAQVRIPLEALDQVLHVWNLFQLAEHEGPQIPFGVVLDWSSGALFVEVFPRIEWIGVKSRFSNNSLGEPTSFILPQDD